MGDQPARGVAGAGPLAVSLRVSAVRRCAAKHRSGVGGDVGQPQRVTAQPHSPRHASQPAASPCCRVADRGTARARRIRRHGAARTQHVDHEDHGRDARLRRLHVGAVAVAVAGRLLDPGAPRHPVVVAKRLGSSRGAGHGAPPNVSGWAAGRCRFRLWRCLYRCWRLARRC